MFLRRNSMSRILQGHAGDSHVIALVERDETRVLLTPMCVISVVYPDIQNTVVVRNDLSGKKGLIEGNSR